MFRHLFCLADCLNYVLKCLKVLVGSFNEVNALVEAFSIIVEIDGLFATLLGTLGTALITALHSLHVAN